MHKQSKRGNTVSTNVLEDLSETIMVYKIAKVLICMHQAQHTRKTSFENIIIQLCGRVKNHNQDQETSLGHANN
jgi:hypothetical protein